MNSYEFYSNHPEGRVVDYFTVFKHLDKTCALLKIKRAKGGFYLKLAFQGTPVKRFIIKIVNKVFKNFSSNNLLCKSDMQMNKRVMVANFVLSPTSEQMMMRNNKKCYKLCQA